MRTDMRDIEQIPRQLIGHGPTPLEHAPRLSDHLGCQLYIKRDDCTGLAGGGNKTRKLEYLIADAFAQDADTLVTIGGLQSNHARQTAAAAAKFGFGCELILEDVAGTPKQDFYHNGNVLLDELLGANIHRLGIDQDLMGYSETLLSQLVEQGKKPYLIPVGGSSVIGSMGYVRCAMEIVEQLKAQNLQIDQIVIGSGSAGTQAGLIAGLIAVGSDIPVLGISVSKTAAHQAQVVNDLLAPVMEYLALDPLLTSDKVHTNGDYFGESYGVPTAAMIDAVKACAALEGLLLDPVYTGKAMSGLFDLRAKNIIKQGSNQLFIHTGGSQGLYAYREIFS
jgi:D-cysteine desulfhydrase/L-cysteate sulfo-lyase